MTRARLIRALALSAWAILIAAPAHSQETTGNLEGRIVDADGHPLANVAVTVRGPALQGARGAVSKEDGAFVVLALPVGEYGVRLQQLGYAPRELERVPVRLGQTTSLGEIRLEVNAIPVEGVSVSARAALVDVRSAATAENLGADMLQALPVDRDYKTAITLLPHANASTLGDPVNIAGATGLENRYFVDGIDVTDSYRSADATRLPPDFVQEVQVRAGGYEAEYRSSLGGTVNVVTYSGGDQLRGQGFAYYTGNSFAATPRSVPGSPDAGQHYSVYDVGSGVGGPIVRERLWYYAAYNPSSRREDVNIPGWGTFADRNTAHSFAGKLTWRANSNHTFVLTGLGDPSVGRDVVSTLQKPLNVDPLLFDIHRGGLGGMLEGRHLAGDHVLFRTSLSVASRREQRVPATARGRSELAFTDSTGVLSGGGSTDDDRSRVVSAAASCTWITGAHELKAGGEFRATRLEFDNHSEILAQSSGTSYYYQRSAFQGHVGTHGVSGYVQDGWSVVPRLRFNLGLRWDGQSFISSRDEVAQSILDEWQPRLGVIWQPGRLGTQKAFASYGRFYQDLTTAPLFWYYNQNSHFYSANFDHDPRTDPAGADTLADYSLSIQPKVKGLQGQNFEETTVGYERTLGANARFGLRGIYRRLRQGLEDGIDPVTGAVWFGNPGRAGLASFPPMRREYTALELSGQGSAFGRLEWLASYVLSRNRGNYEGLFDSQYNNPFPNATGLFDVPDELVHADGLLPNDRTHVLKLAGSWRAGGGVTLGSVVTWESGTPRSELGGTRIGGIYHAYIGERGDAGRTPALFDLNLRVRYEPRVAATGRWRPRVTMDAFHVASARRPVRYDEIHFQNLDASGNEIDPNPNYGRVTAFQPPMAVRVGMDVQF